MTRKINSYPEEQFNIHCSDYGLPAPERNFIFHPTRKWRLDFAWPKYKVAVEVEGGSFIAGRHTRGAGFREDCVKYAQALILGWLVLRVLPEQINSLDAINWTRELINQRSYEYGCKVREKPPGQAD